MPAFDWPAADPPVYQFPMDESNAAHNAAQDEQALDSVRVLISEVRASKGQEIAAVIMEPIMSEGGDNPFSANFAQGVRSLTKELGIYMIVDEVQTGVCTSGTYWAHEQWGLDRWARNRKPPFPLCFSAAFLSFCRCDSSAI